MKFWNNFLDYDLWQSFCNQIFVVLKISIETLTLIPQHYYKYNFLSTWATKSCSGFCHVKEFTYISVAKKQENSINGNFYKLNIYTDNEAYARVFKTDFG